MRHVRFGRTFTQKVGIKIDPDNAAALGYRSDLRIG